ncbi:hypothetical protein DSOUD_3263 [Desulfuromonas soudanensis]|uniref:Type VI secretion system FHA domain-containing protein n=1 Tax=Desulfuromonas soudanensis TaxID=1603606 RepID=A0A0M3QGK9_9BACT|nr:type VI secretion system-associated FHA domain protein [Desulfuromonas soudanensis]ALC17983.1 hypothetical protein DSOUD_3263 [Desulfuromonas soudanensis]
MNSGDQTEFVVEERKGNTVCLRREAEKAAPVSGTVAVLMQGLARLIEGQRCFAEEFGLAYGRVFCEEFEDFKGNTPDEVFRLWADGGEEGILRLTRVFDDLVYHQLALVAALDGVARETVAELSPRRVAEQAPGWLGLKPFVWRSYRLLHRKLEHNPNLRHARLVLPGFVKGYVRCREEWKKQTAQQQEKGGAL